MGLPEAASTDSPFTKPRPKRHRPRGSKILVTLGVLMVVVGVVVAQRGSHGFRSAANDIRNSGDDVRNSLLVQLAVPDTDVVDLEPGRYDVFAVYGLGAATTTSGATPTSPPTTSVPPPTTRPGPPTDRDRLPRSDDDLPLVTIIDPDGRRVTTVEPSIEALYSGGFGQLEAFESFTATTAGRYRIEVRGEGARNGAIQEVGIGPSLDDGDMGRLLTGGLLAVVGYLAAAIGFVLAASGGIWYLVSSGTPASPSSGPGGFPARPGPAGRAPGPPMGGGNLPGGWVPPGPQGPPGWVPPPGQYPPPGWAPPPAAASAEDRRPPPPAPPPPPGR